MKKITIGRGRECDVRLEDSTDRVSRRQAVITVSPFGKMEIYDTSANGTYVNGEKVEKPAGLLVKRGDQVNFAHVVDLDWSKVRDPYRKIKLSVVVLMLLAVVVAAVLLFANPFAAKPESAVKTPEAPVLTEDTIVPPQPQEVPVAFDKGNVPDVGKAAPAPKKQQRSAVKKEDTAEPDSKEKLKQVVTENDNANDAKVDEHIQYK